MITYEDECVGCPKELGCFGNACPNLNVPHYYCDRCGYEVDKLRDFNGEQLCDDCILKEFEEVK